MVEKHRFLHFATQCCNYHTWEKENCVSQHSMRHAVFSVRQVAPTPPTPDIILPKEREARLLGYGREYGGRQVLAPALFELGPHVPECTAGAVNETT